MKFLKKAVKMVSGFLGAMRDDHVGAYAAQTAYFIMLSFFPFIILLVTLIRYTSITPADVYEAARAIFPASMDSFILSLINEVYSKTAVTVSVSAIVAAWSAGKGFLALMRGMNTIYNVEERRNYIILRLRSALYTVVFVIAIILSLVVLVFGNSIHEAAVEHMPFLAVVTGMIVRLKGIVGVCFLTVVFMLLYRFVPNRRARLLSQAPGALFSSVCWYLFSIGFSIYVEYSPGISNMYGSLTTIVLVMLWLYFCMYIILLGAEINSYFEDQFRRVAYYRQMLREQKKES
ncbi:YihY/virulence factor BrkB family protein [Lachnoclostridium sp. An131]|jgi:membrane protein|uniref:YihY/virulence factor BrkB family protein n=1 Tax=Lachnoclostridium sp. An131 TaxID=1965555 RepID=UPI001FA85749|nr:YihY/virulence factor BrkB family protein [Lachnoclostridium sp. An131]